ncbi:DUF2690 domain-containing protein [Nonomuraea sp. NPDC005650]|uniref:DUF2690 domain-containing protein n=1 Tax=Nonomuraea sp. NPDC005650 TaxID=3157045 RepID=UPI0033B59175
MSPSRCTHALRALVLAVPLALLPVTGASGATDDPGSGHAGRDLGDVRAAARPCFGGDCDGRDPAATTCTRNAYTVVAGGEPVRVRAFGGYVELRYGPGQLINGRPSCQVNWARFVMQGQGNSYNVWVERTLEKAVAKVSDKVLTQYSGGDKGTGIIYSDQVYAPDGIPARACVAPASVRAARAGATGKVCTRAV